MPIVIWFPGCVEHACTAVKPATSPPRQINGPTKQGMQHTPRTRPDMGGCRDKSKRQRECSLNRISTAPAVDALPRQEQRGLYESSLQPFSPTACTRTNQDLLCFYSVCVLLCFLSLDLPEGVMSISAVYWLHQCLDRFAVCTEKLKEFLLFAFCCTRGFFFVLCMLHWKYSHDGYFWQGHSDQ